MAALFAHPLASRVGRRIAAVVVAAVLVPLVSFGTLVFVRARNQVDAQEHDRLHQTAKLVALNGMERLGMLEQALRWLATTGQGGAAPHRLGQGVALEWFEAVAVVPREGLSYMLAGAGPAPAVRTADWHRATHGAAVLMRDDRSQGYWLAVGTATGWLLAARVPLAAIFDYDEASPLPERVLVCLLDGAGHTAGCSNDVVRRAVTGGRAELPAHGAGALFVGTEPHAVRTWALPLEPVYGAGTWTVVTLLPASAGQQPLRALARDASLLTAASLIVVILTVLAAVRRHMRPLAVLETAAISVARQDFDVHLRMATGDEFETVADAFNAMVTSIQRQINQLEAFSVGAATALARTIDAKSPWTAGHSERVTALALRIGREMGLDAADLEILHRGGLLHDIGKLRTPPEILDKPGRLTPEERRVIEQHPRDGVLILEPIQDFAPLLPIVLQHHEHVDGRGYPDGLAGDAIHPLARVLAVADVFDALRADRPYRPAMALPDVIAFISERSGTQFDPKVVAAFLRIAARHALDGRETPPAAVAA